MALPESITLLQVPGSWPDLGLMVALKQEEGMGHGRPYSKGIIESGRGMGVSRGILQCFPRESSNKFGLAGKKNVT